MDITSRLREVTLRLDEIRRLADPAYLDALAIVDRLGGIAGLASWARLHASVLAEHSEAA